MLRMGVVVTMRSPARSGLTLSPTCTLYVTISVSIYKYPGQETHHPHTKSPVPPVEAHGPVDEVEDKEHDGEHHQEHIIHLRPGEKYINIKLTHNHNLLYQ